MFCGGSLGAAGLHRGGLKTVSGGELGGVVRGDRGGVRPRPGSGGAGGWWSEIRRVCSARWLLLTRAPHCLPALSNISFYPVKDDVRVGQRPLLLLRDATLALLRYL